MKNILVIPVCVAVTACATPAAEPEAYQAAQLAEPAQAAAIAPDSESFQAAERQETEMVAGNEPSQQRSIEALDSPEVEQIPHELIPGRAVSDDPIVCERITPTGSILPTRVCRDRRYMQLKENADREIFDDIKRNTALGNSRL